MADVDRKATSRFAETVANPYRFGRQHVVFDLLRMGYSREELLGPQDVLASEVLRRTQTETRGPKSLLDKVLHDLRHNKPMDVIVDPEDGGYRIVPEEREMEAASADAEDDEQNEVRESPPDRSAVSSSDSAKPSDDGEAASIPDEVPYDPDEYSVTDITDIYMNTHDA